MYYDAIAPALLPHVRGRLCSVVDRRGRVMRETAIDDLDALRSAIEGGGASLLVTASDFAALRIEGRSATRVALRARELVTAAGLTAFVKASRASELDVVVPLGDVPAEAARALGALLARMLADLAGDLGATVESVDAMVAPHAMAVPAEASGRATASLPLAWNELDELQEIPDLTRLDRVAERVSRGVADPMRGMFAEPVDLARAVAAIESFVRDPAAR
jgi:DNA primase